MVKFPFSGRQVLLSGIFLVLLFWGLNWLLPGLRSHWAFFPLWLGYILILNGWTQIRKGDSLLSRDLSTWLLLFLTSAPVWWIFEWLNKVANYWHYLGVEAFTDLEYNIFATISFSTVIPVIFSTSEWLASFQFTNRFRRGIKAGAKRDTRIFFFILGWLMLAFFLYIPEYGAAFLWMSLYFILDPVNYWLGYPSLLKETANKNWRTVLILWIASIICGFFWEMWNYFAYPKWIYEVPFVDFWYIFEMPLPGYLGYLPFALELYAMYHFILGVLGIKSQHHFIL